MRNFVLIAAILGGMFWIDGRYFDGRVSAYALRETSYRVGAAQRELALLWVWIERTV